MTSPLPARRMNPTGDVSMTMWKPGMRCVCVNDDLVFDGTYVDKNDLRVGVVYTIRSLHFADVLYLALEEISHKKAFEATAFRPLSETRLDQFRQHLAPKPKVEERV